MPGPNKPKKDRGGNSGILRHRWRTRRRKRDLDQINGDLQPEIAEKLLKQEVDIDQTGDAQFYCLHCARYFIDDYSMKSHFRSKVHKRRLKALELEPYTIEDSERAAGHGSYIPPKKRRIQTQLPIKEEDIIKTDDDFEMR